MRLPIFVTLLFALPATAQSLELPVQGFLSDAGVAIVDEVTLEFRLIDDAAQAITCESITLTPDAGFFTARLGTVGASACDSLPTTIDALAFQSPVSLEVAEAGQAAFGLFPIGDVPRAGIAQRLASDHPRVIGAPDEVALQAALTAAAANSPTIIELGPATYVFGAPLTIPAGTTLRGRGRTATVINGRLLMEGDSRLQGVQVTNNTPNGTLLELRPATRTRIEVVDVALSGTVTTDSLTGLSILTGDATSTVDLDNVSIDLTAITGAIAISDLAGVALSGRRVRIDVGTEVAQLTIGIRVGDPGAQVEQGNLSMDDLVIDVITLGGFAAGIETNAADPNSTDAGRARVTNAQIQVLATAGRGVSSQGTQFVVEHSTITADHPLFRLPLDGLRTSTLDVVSSGLDPQATPNLEAESDNPQCRFTYRVGDLQVIRDDCTDVL